MPVMGASPTAECSPGVEVVLLSNLVAPVSTPVLCIVILSMHIYTYLSEGEGRPDRQPGRSQTKTRLNSEFVSQLFLYVAPVDHRAWFTVVFTVLNADRATSRSINLLIPCRCLQWLP